MPCSMVHLIVLIEELLGDLFSRQTLVHVLLLAVAFVVVDAPRTFEPFLSNYMKY